MALFDFNTTQIQPFMGDQRISTIYWLPSGLDETMGMPGMLGSIDPSVGLALDVDQSVSLNNILSWPAYMPFSHARPIVISTTGDWQDFTFTLTYKNVFGIWMIGSQTGPNNAASEISAPTGTTPVINASFGYPQYLYDLTITRDDDSNLPAAPLLIDWANRGITTRISLQDSQRYFGTSLQVLNMDECNGQATTTLYLGHQDNYPSMVQNLTLRYPMNAFWETFGNTLDTAIVDGSTIAPSLLFANELMTPFPSGSPVPNNFDASFLIPGTYMLSSSTPPVNVETATYSGEVLTNYAFAALPLNVQWATTSKIVQVPYAVGHIWLQIDSTNTSPLLINVLQNAVAR